MVFNDVIKEYSGTSYIKENTCYNWIGDWNIPSDIGGDGGMYDFRMWEVKDLSDESNFDCTNADLPGCYEKISNAEFAQFEIDPGEPEDRPPDAEVEAAFDSVQVGESALFSADQSTDDHGIINFQWFVDGQTLVSDGGQTFSHVFDDAGEHTVCVDAVDGSGQTSSDCVRIYVAEEPNEKPTARISVSDRSPKTDEAFSVSGERSSDSDGSIVSYSWSNGRNVKSFDQAYQSAGEKTLRLTVKDDNGATDTASVTINVQERDSDDDGVVDTNDDCPNTPGSQELNGCPDSDGDGIKDSNDNCPNTRGLQEFNGCPDPDPDNDGVEGEQDQCPETAGQLANGCPNTRPEITNFIVSKSTVETGEQLTAEVSASDPDNQELEYSWSIPDSSGGGPVLAEEVSFTFKSTGTKTVSVEVTDGIASVNESKTVTVVKPDEPEQPKQNETLQDPDKNETTGGSGGGADEDSEDEAADDQELGPLEQFFFGIVDFIGGIF